MKFIVQKSGVKCILFTGILMPLIITCTIVQAQSPQSLKSILINLGEHSNYKIKRSKQQPDHVP